MHVCPNNFMRLAVEYILIYNLSSLIHVPLIICLVVTPCLNHRPYRTINNGICMFDDIYGKICPLIKQILTF